MTDRDQATLERALDRARALRVDDAVVRARADEYVRWSRRPAARRAAVWWLAGAGALAAAIAVAVAVWPNPAAVRDEVASTVVRIGGRVAVLPSADAVYTIVRSSTDDAEIAVVEGTVTARLYPGSTPYRLRMTSDALETVATGTIFTVSKPRGGRAYAVVHEGRVQVVDRDGAREVSAGQSWPVTPPTPAITTAAQRLADAAPGAVAAGPAPVPVDAAVAEPDAAAPVDDRGLPPGGSAAEGRRGLIDAAVRPPAPAPRATLDEHWHRARQLRGQGHPREALAELDELIARDDAVWSPIAIAEAMRIEASPLGDHAAVLALGDRFLARYAAHALTREVIDMLCRAHRALGHQDLPSACLIRHEP
jgi:hypothetical protein